MYWLFFNIEFIIFKNEVWRRKSLFWSWIKWKVLSFNLRSRTVMSQSWLILAEVAQGYKQTGSGNSKYFEIVFSPLWTINPPPPSDLFTRKFLSFNFVIKNISIEGYNNATWSGKIRRLKINLGHEKRCLILCHKNEKTLFLKVYANTYCVHNVQNCNVVTFLV